MTQFFKRKTNFLPKPIVSIVISLLLGAILSPVVYAGDCDTCAKTGGLGCPTPPPPERRPCSICALP
jgi:hypothetical protein